MSENKVRNEQELWDILSEPTGAEPEKKAKPKSAEGRFAKPGPVKQGRKPDGFFFACMAGVAAVSVAATLVLGGMTGGVQNGLPLAGSDRVALLEQENAELRTQLELQKEQIKKLQADLLDLTAGSAEQSVISTEPGADNELTNAQLEAYDIWGRIQAAYADFDRETLEELIPEMDKRLTYLSSEALSEYYLILEYVEQPSNG